MNLQGLSDDDHIFYRNGEWYFLDQNGAAVGPYRSPDVAIQKWREYLLYLGAH